MYMYYLHVCITYMYVFALAHDMALSSGTPIDL